MQQSSEMEADIEIPENTQKLYLSYKSWEAVEGIKEDQSFLAVKEEEPSLEVHEGSSVKK